MKKSIALFALAIPLVFTSCFKDEPLNTECDIEQVILHSTAADKVFFNPSDTIQEVLFTDSVVSVNVPGGGLNSDGILVSNGVVTANDTSLTLGAYASAVFAQ